MKKRVISLILTFALVLSMAAVGIVSVSAADESSAESSADTNVYFKVPDFWTTEYNIKINDIKTTVWFKVFGINPPEGFAETSWQSKSVKCKYDAEKDLYYFDTAVLKDSKGKPLLFEDGYDYGLIFSARNADTTELNPQTCDIVFSTECVGDTVYVTSNTMENTMDSKKKVYLGYWTNPDVAAKYGPHTSITSLGVLQGEEFGAKFGPHEDKALAIANFIKDFSANAQEDTCTTLCEKLNVT
ncbi:MAG: hypothetical protein PUD24_00565, partial [Oscillospiraceae bacterium]|nr:hypothetical protein [Oscillospiraceae bacterium]